MENCFVLMVCSDGTPGKLIAADDFDDAKQKCAEIARQHNVTEEDIKQYIFENECDPGVFFPADPEHCTPIAGVWVVLSE